MPGIIGVLSAFRAVITTQTIHTETLNYSKLDNHFERQLREDWLIELPWSCVSSSSASCVAVSSVCQFHVFKSVWQNLLDFAVAWRFSVALGCARSEDSVVKENA